MFRGIECERQQRAKQLAQLFLQAGTRDYALQEMDKLEACDFFKGTKDLARQEYKKLKEVGNE